MTEGFCLTRNAALQDRMQQIDLYGSVYTYYYEIINVKPVQLLDKIKTWLMNYFSNNSRRLQLE